MLFFHVPCGKGSLARCLRCLLGQEEDGIGGVKEPPAVWYQGHVKSEFRTFLSVATPYPGLSRG